jgi:glycosyltransferase involved in cell wall biosynthesis
MPKRILVGVPVYRGSDHVAETLRSLQAQTFQDFEVLISVDAADEQSAAACEPFLADPRYRMVMQPKRLGWAGNLNWLWAQNESEFFCYYQQDDLTDPSYFAVLIAEAERHPAASVVFCDIQFFGAHEEVSTGSSITGADPAERVMAQLETFYWGSLRGLVRREALRAAAPLRITATDSFGEDFTWYLKLARYGEMVHVPQLLYFKRAHVKSLTTEWFEKWPLEKRRTALVTLCTSLLDAALAAAVTLDERLAFFFAVLERLVLKQWILPVDELTGEQRARLIGDFFAAMRDEPLYDHRSDFDMSPDALMRVAIERFGLPSPSETAPSAPHPGEMSAIAAAERQIRARIGYAFGEPIEFREPAARRFMQGAWGEMEHWGVWITGPMAELVLWPAPQSDGPRYVTACLKWFWAEWRSRLLVDVMAQDKVFATWEFCDPKGPERFCYMATTIPAGLVSADRPLRLTFAVRDLEKPEELGLSPRAPVLSLGLQQLKIV